MLQHPETTAPPPGLLACSVKTRIGLSAVFGQTRTEPLPFVSHGSHRASTVSRPEVASDLGLYSQPDPIGLQGGLNLFGYARANPLLFKDPKGLAPCSKCDQCPCGAWLIVGVEAQGIAFTGGGGAAFVTFHCLCSRWSCGGFASTLNLIGGGLGGGASVNIGIAGGACNGNQLGGGSFGFGATNFFFPWLSVEGGSSTPDSPPHLIPGELRRPSFVTVGAGVGGGPTAYGAWTNIAPFSCSENPKPLLRNPGGPY